MDRVPPSAPALPPPLAARLAEGLRAPGSFAADADTGVILAPEGATALDSDAVAALIAFASDRRLGTAAALLDLRLDGPDGRATPTACRVIDLDRRRRAVLVIPIDGGARASRVAAAAVSAAPAPVVEQPAAPPGGTVRILWRSNADGVVTQVGDRLRRLVGEEAGAIVGRRWHDLLGESVLDTGGGVKKALTGRETASGMELLWSSDRHAGPVPMQWSGLPVFEAGRRFAGFRGFLLAPAVIESEPAAPSPLAPAAEQTPAPSEAVASEPEPQPVAPSLEIAPEPPPPALMVEPPRAAPMDASIPSMPHLSAAERNAFREIARALGARIPEPAPEPLSPPEKPVMSSAAVTALAPVAANDSAEPGFIEPTIEAARPAEVVAASPVTPPEGEKSVAPATDEAPPDQANDSIASGDVDESPAAVAEPLPATLNDATEPAPEAASATAEAVQMAAEPAANAPEESPAEPEPPAEPDAPAIPGADAASLAAVAEAMRALTGKPNLAPPESDAEQPGPKRLDEVEASPPEDLFVDGSLEAGARDDSPEAVVQPEAAQEPASSGESQAQPDAPPSSYEDVVATAASPEESSPPTQSPAAATSQTAGPDGDAAPLVAAFATTPEPVQENSEPAQENPVDAAAQALAAAVGAISSIAGRPRPQPDEAPADPLAAHARELVDRIPVGVLVNRGNKVLFANRTLLELLEYPSAAAIEAQGGVAALFRGRAPLSERDGPTGPVLITAREGVSIAVDARLQGIAWGGAPATLVTFRRAIDVEVGQKLRSTELDLRAREAELRETRGVLDIAADGVAIIDEDGRLLSLNRTAEALFGYDQNEVAGEPISTLFAPESHALAADYFEGLKSGGVRSVMNDGRELVGRVRQGGRIPLFVTFGQISDKPERKFCAVLRDLSPWKKAERDLVDARKAAEDASAQKSDFLAKISHEIRTPLNAIIGFAEVMMEERFGTIGNERYKDYLRDIHASGGHVISLVNDLLDLSKIEAGKLDMTFVSVDANEILRGAVSLMQPQSQRARVVLRSAMAPKLPAVVADERALKQVVINLLSNAVKFTDPGGQVIVSTTLTDLGEVAIRIRDTGIGMSEKELAEAMEPFRQIATSRRQGGTGLGLPLTKALVEANRASLKMSSVKNEGTLAEVVFPPTRVLAE